jgi:putative RecB family exonuclease
MPPRLSPTAISAFKECPQMFLFRNLWRLPEPPSKVLTRGILVHSALENMFKLPPEERASRLHDTLRDEWRAERIKPSNAGLFATREEERAWGLECLRLLDSYLQFEDPARLPSGEPLATESWLSAVLGGSTGGVKLVGKIDRLDRVDTGGSGGAAGGGGGDGDGGGAQRRPPPGSVAVVDYKTGKAPSQKYSAAVNERIRSDAFFQLRCYALLLARGAPPRELSGKVDATAAKARRLRLLYLGESEVGGGATALDEELPADPAEYNALLRATEEEVLAVWAQIQALVEGNDPAAFSHCSRPFCQCHDLRPLVFPERSSDPTVSTLTDDEPDFFA